jgi:hypothetical protein
MFGQLQGCRGLRELTDITTAHAKKSFHLGFGKTPINKSTLSKANNLRDYRIFEKFAFHMVFLAQKRRITREFELHGRFYAVDSTTIDLCMSLFSWAKFRSTKSGIKIHTQVDIVTEIPVFYRITNANVHDVNAMDWLTYEPLACYVFDRGYFDLARLYQIAVSGAFFIIREKKRPDYEIIDGEDVLDGTDNVLRDQTVIFTKKQNKEKYPGKIRRIVYYAPDLHRTFTYYTNNFYLAAKEIAFFINIGGRSSSFSNGSSNTSRSSLSEVRATMLCAFRFMLPSSHTVSSESLSTTSSLVAQSFRSCEFWAAPCSPRMTFWNSSSRLRMRRTPMMDSSKLNLYTINIY